MSGGHFSHQYRRLEELADDIERDFIENGKYLDEDYSAEYRGFGKRPVKTYDRIGDATEEQRPIILKEVKSLIKDLRKCAKRAKELEWYMSQDASADSYISNLKHHKLIK